MAQRRNFVRLSKKIKVEFRQIVERYANASVPPNISYTTTISGNGLTILAAKKAEKGMKYEMDIFIKDGDDSPINAAGEVLGNSEIEGGQFEVKIKITEIDESDRDRLAAYILREDLKVKKAAKKAK
ncbi:MAG TPA: PilZ domain-containing protein [Candidatus Goldiibacteriota bacterium]|nr:PilZ domain-containing protein [Candidatus Goldiibacteriota bacterium]HRQ43906.1 PilZ domain-containing protein [Candidatus Goldiibacteriota bacterium]